MTYQDPVFPVPEPTFLWVYDLIVHTQDGASVTVGTGRRWRYTQGASVGFVGYIAHPDAKEIERAAARGVRIDAVVRAPHGTAITEVDHLEAPAGPGSTGNAVPDVLVGRYEVNVVRHTAADLRVLLTRIPGEDPPHAP